MITRIFLSQDEDGFLKKAAQIVTEASAQAIERTGVFTWVLSGGSTPKKLYALLSDSYYRHRINWTKTHVFWGDERMVPPNHPDSNYKMAFDCLLSRVPIPSVNIHRIPAEMENAMETARAHQQHLKVFFRTLVMNRPDSHIITETATGDIFPRFDLMMLGVGEDGHTCSLFPGSSLLSEKRSWVSGGYIENVSGSRVTLTFPIINNAHRVMFLCAGEGKAAIVKEIFQETEGAPRFPVQRVRPNPGELVWLLDRGAGARLPAAIRYSAAHV